jgi:hypothetical protein
LAANTPNGSGHLEPKAESLLSGKWIARHVFGDEGCFPDLGCVQGRLHIGMDQQHHRHVGGCGDAHFSGAVPF